MSNKKIITLIPDKILPGSISTAMVKCGIKKCHCQHDNPKLHGPYFRWTGFIDGKRTTLTITKEEARTCKIRIKNWKKIKEKISKIAKEAILKAPWVERKNKNQKKSPTD